MAFFDIPMGMYNGQNALGYMLNNYPQYIQGVYNLAQRGIGQFAQRQLEPAVQNTINSLASRGMLNSSVASNTMSNTITDLLRNTQGYQMGLQSSMANQMAQYPQYLWNPYNLYARMLMGTM